MVALPNVSLFSPQIIRSVFWCLICCWNVLHVVRMKYFVAWIHFEHWAQTHFPRQEAGCVISINGTNVQPVPGPLRAERTVCSQDAVLREVLVSLQFQSFLRSDIGGSRPRWGKSLPSALRRPSLPFFSGLCSTAQLPSSRHSSLSSAAPHFLNFLQAVPISKQCPLHHQTSVSQVLPDLHPGSSQAKWVKDHRELFVLPTSLSWLVRHLSHHLLESSLCFKPVCVEPSEKDLSRSPSSLSPGWVL